MPAIYVGERPKEWGPIGTMIMIRPKAPAAKQPQPQEDKPNASTHTAQDVEGKEKPTADKTE